MLAKPNTAQRNAVPLSSEDWDLSVSVLRPETQLVELPAGLPVDVKWRGVHKDRQGFVFGLKQAAVPLSTLLGGLAIPVIALTVGWRWAFVGAAVLGLFVAMAVPGGSTDPSERRPVRDLTSSVPSLVALSVGGGLGAGTAVALGGFLVAAILGAGTGEHQAAVLLIVGSLSALAVRLIVGWLADVKLRRPLLAVEMLLAIGSVGYIGLRGEGALQTVAVLLAFGAGWGWNGLFHYAVVTANPGVPASATGITQTGVFVGAALGPPIFGLVVQNFSFDIAWTGALVVALLAAVAMEIGRRRFHG